MGEKSHEQLNQEHARRINNRYDVGYKNAGINLANLDKEPEDLQPAPVRVKEVIRKFKSICFLVESREKYTDFILPYLKANGVLNIKSIYFKEPVYVGSFGGYFWKGTLSEAVRKNITVRTIENIISNDIKRISRTELLKGLKAQDLIAVLNSSDFKKKVKPELIKLLYTEVGVRIFMRKITEENKPQPKPKVINKVYLGPPR